MPQYDVKHAVRPVRAAAILILPVVAVLISTLKSLAEVVVVVVPIDVITVIAVVCVLVSVRALVVRLPPVLAICASGPVTLLIAIVHGLAEQIGAVLVRLVRISTTAVLIDRGRVVIRIVIVIGVTVVLKIDLLLTQALNILFLETVLRHPILLL